MHLAVDRLFQAVPIPFWESTTDRAIHPTKAQIVSGFHTRIAALARAGNNRIVDQVLQEREWWSENAALLTPFDAMRVTSFVHWSNWIDASRSVVSAGLAWHGFTVIGCMVARVRSAARYERSNGGSLREPA